MTQEPQTPDTGPEQPEPSDPMDRLGEMNGARITDPQALKVFTHPLRIRLYRALFVARTATASQLADEVDEAVSLVSYHLRKLAEPGFIVEAEGQSTDGRERWWRPATESGWYYRASDFPGPEGAAVSSAVSRALLAERRADFDRYLDQRGSWPQEWADAAFSSDSPGYLNPGELQQMSEELSAVVRRWIEHGRAAEERGDTEGREHIAVHLFGFPVRRP